MLTTYMLIHVCISWQVQKVFEDLHFRIHLIIGRALLRLNLNNKQAYFRFHAKSAHKKRVYTYIHLDKPKPGQSIYLDEPPKNAKCTPRAVGSALVNMLVRGVCENDYLYERSPSEQHPRNRLYLDLPHQSGKTPDLNMHPSKTESEENFDGPKPRI